MVVQSLKMHYVHETDKETATTQIIIRSYKDIDWRKLDK